MICFDQNQRIHDDLRPFSWDAPYSWWAFRTDRSLFLVLCSSSDALDWLSDWGNQFNKAASAPSFVEHLQRLQKIEACLQRHLGLGSFHPSMTSSHAEYEHNLFGGSSSQLVQPAIFGLPGGFFARTTIYPQNDEPWKWCFLLNMAFFGIYVRFLAGKKIYNHQECTKPCKSWDQLPFPQLVFLQDFWLPSNRSSNVNHPSGCFRR